MSSLPALTQGSPGSYFFALASGGGGGGSSLQSPVNVIPSAVDGSTNLSLVTSTGGNGANILISDTTGNDAALTVAVTESGNADIFMGLTNATQVQISAPTLTGAGQLQIVNATTNYSFLSVDTINNDVVLGEDLAAVGFVSGLTQSNNSLVIKDAAGTAANSMLLSPLSPTASVISQGIASGGTLNLGSSVACPGTLVISDAGVGTGSVSVTGAVGVSGNIISSSGIVQGLNVQVANGGAVSTSAAVGAGGVLKIQPSFNAPVPNISVSDANTTINGLILVPNTLSFQGSGNITAFRTLQTTGVVCGDNTTASIPNPAGLVAGLYLILARGGSAFCSVSAISYYNGSTWAWGGGGCCPAFVSAPPSFIGIQGSGATLTLANGGGAGSVTMDFTFLQLGGNLGI
jgi:hypothetical protein